MTNIAPPSKPTTKPCAPSATAWWASCTAAYVTTRATTNTTPGHTASRLPLDSYEPGMSSWALARPLGSRLRGRHRAEGNAERRILPLRWIPDQPAQQRGAELDRDLLGAAPAGGPQPAICAQRHSDVPERQHVRVAFVELAAGDSAVDHISHMLVDRRLRGADVGDLLLGEPLGDVRAFLEVDRGAIDVVRDVLQQPAGEVEDRLARGP